MYILIYTNCSSIMNLRIYVSEETIIYNSWSLDGRTDWNVAVDLECNLTIPAKITITLLLLI